MANKKMREIGEHNLLAYALGAYDRDNDYYGYFVTSNSFDELMKLLPMYNDAVHNDELRRDSDGEPFDWVFIEDTATQRHIVVGSPDRF